MEEYLLKCICKPFPRIGTWSKIINNDEVTVQLYIEHGNYVIIGTLGDKIAKYTRQKKDVTQQEIDIDTCRGTIYRLNH